MKYEIILAILLLVGTAFAASLQIQTSVAPSQIVPGNDGYLQITITNSGTTLVNDVKIRSIKFDSGIVQKSVLYTNSLGSLSASKSISQIISFSVPSTTSSGFYSVELQIDSCTTSTCETLIQNSIITVQSSAEIDVLSVSPKTFHPGEKTTIAFNVTNRGKSAVNDIVFSWQDNMSYFLPLGTSNRYLISLLKPGEIFTITQDVIISPSAQPGTYQLSLRTTYNDQTGSQHNVSSIAGVNVVGKFDFVVALDSQSIITPGKDGEANVKIANGGDQNAEFLTLRILPSDKFSRITPSVIYIGTLKSDDYDTEKIKFMVADVEPGTYSVNFELSYKDMYGDEYKKNYSVGMSVLSKEDAANGQKGDGTLITVISAIIVLVVIYLLYKRTKKR